MGKLTITMSYENSHGYVTTTTKEVHTKCRIDDLCWEHENDAIDVMNDLYNEIIENENE